jgi:hypothetical protein
MSLPFERQVNNRSRTIYAIERLKRFNQHCPLLRHIKRFTKDMAKGPFHKNRSGRFDFLGKLPYDGYSNGRYA